MKGTTRNKPCACGSGIKAKRCPGPHREEIEEAYLEDFYRTTYDPRTGKRRLQSLMLASLAISAPLTR